MTAGEGSSDRSAGRPSVRILRAELAELLIGLDELGLFQAAAYASMSLDVLDRIVDEPSAPGGTAVGRD